MPDCSEVEDKTQNLANDEDMGYKEKKKDIVGTYYNKIMPTQNNVNLHKVADYSKRLQAHEKLAPIEAVEISGKGTYIVDGHHRYIASQQTGIPIEIKIIQSKGPIGMPDWSEVQWKEYISEAQFWGIDKEDE